MTLSADGEPESGSSVGNDSLMDISRWLWHEPCRDRAILAGGLNMDFGKLIPCYRETPCLAQPTHLSPHTGLGPGHLAVQLCWCPLQKKRALTQPDSSSQQEFLPFGMPHEQTAQLFQQSQEGWESWWALCSGACGQSARQCQKKLLLSAQDSGYNNNTQHYILFF